MRTLFSGEELNRFLVDHQEFTLPNGDKFYGDDYFFTKDFADFSPLVVYDIQRLEHFAGKNIDSPEFSFAECFYAWCKQIGTDIQIEHEVFQGISDYLMQPVPIKNNLPAVWDLVIQDMQNRDKVGQERYGTRLQPHNGRDVLVDAYSEALDLSVYLRQAIFERDGK